MIKGMISDLPFDWDVEISNVYQNEINDFFNFVFAEVIRNGLMTNNINMTNSQIK